MFGHVSRADNDIIKKVLTETTHEKRLLGRLRMRWSHCREKYQNVGKNVSVDLAFNREK